MMKSGSDVAVMMSTYNGSDFIKEQMDSVLDQKGVNVRYLIRDDGSSDDTLDIVSDYEKTIVIDKGNNLGVGNSFMELVYAAGDETDYYAFCDQDDIWLPEKLDTAVKMIGDADAPVLYTSNQRLVDADGMTISDRYDGNPGVDWMQIVCNNKVSGCTMVWNRQLQKLLCDEKRRPSKKLLEKRIHDVWVAGVASVTGRILYDEQPHILYRQHENNVVGVRKNSLIGQWIKKIRDPRQRNGRSDLCNELCRKYADVIRDNDILEDLEMIGSYRDNRKYKTRLLNDKRIIGYSGESFSAYKIKVRLGLL